MQLLINKVRDILKAITICCFYVTILSECTYHQDCSGLKEAKLLMDKDFKKKLVIPEKMLISKINIGSNKYSDSTFNPKSEFRIIYFFDADCSSCVSELNKVKSQLNVLNGIPNLKLILIASTPTEAQLDFVLNKAQIPHPVYYNTGYKVFKKINNFPLDDILYDSMLINEKNEILLFGSFFDNEKARKMMLEIINCN